MALQVQKWGNSLAVRIPKPYAEQLRWDQNTEVRASVQDGKLVIEAVQTHSYALEHMVAAITPENTHAETSTGPAMGNEGW